MVDIEKHKISSQFSIRKAVTQMDAGGLDFCVCVEKNDEVIGVITGGDFRKAVHGGIQLDENVKNILNTDFLFVEEDYKIEDIQKIFNENIIERVPVLAEGQLIDILSKDDVFDAEGLVQINSLNSTVVIMAGGKGTRLDPFTRVLPKPLIPFGKDPIIKVIMDKFHDHGITEFYVVLNEKGRMIKAFFYDHDFDFNIQYVEESKPIGTAGALKFLEGTLHEPFFVSNCDVIINADYASILDYHNEEHFELTLVGSMQNYTIPYGVCEANKDGELIALQEKPHFDFLANAGLYLMNPSVLRFIPENAYFDMTDLIVKIQNSDLKVGVFPVSEKSWIDVGQWESV